MCYSCLARTKNEWGVCVWVLFSAWDTRGGKFLKHMLGGFVFSRSQLLLLCLLWEKAEVKIREGWRQLSSQRNLMYLKLRSNFRHFLKCHGCGIVEGDWWPVVGDISACVVFLAASFCVWILLPLRGRQLSSSVQLFNGFIVFHLLDVLYNM